MAVVVVVVWSRSKPNCAMARYKLVCVWELQPLAVTNATMSSMAVSPRLKLQSENCRLLPGVMRRGISIRSTTPATHSHLHFI